MDLLFLVAFFKAFGEAFRRPFSTAYHAAADSEGTLAQKALEGNGIPEKGEML